MDRELCTFAGQLHTEYIICNLMFWHTDFSGIFVCPLKVTIAQTLTSILLSNSMLPDVAVFTRTLQLSLSWVESTQFLVLIPICILILSSHLHLGLHKGLFPVDVPFKILKAVLPSSILATRPAYLNHPDYTGWRVHLWRSSLWSLFHFPLFALLAQIFTSGSCF